MNSPPVQPKPCRFVALDVHKRYAVAAASDAEQRVVLKPHRIALDDIVAWARRHLQPTDAVVLEATANAWTLHDQLPPFGAAVTVAHPLLVKLIACTRVKTDARDTLSLARLLSAGLLPAVWVPPLEVRERRALIGQRRRLVRQRTQAYNRLHSVLHHHTLVPPGGGVCGPACRPWWEGLALPTTERLRVRQDLALLDCIGPLIGEVEQEIARLSTAEPWAGQVAFLVHLPGIGVLTAMALLGAIGDITRFPTARKADWTRRPRRLLTAPRGDRARAHNTAGRAWSIGSPWPPPDRVRPAVPSRSTGKGALSRDPAHPWADARACYHHRTRGAVRSDALEQR